MRALKTMATWRVLDTDISGSRVAWPAVIREWGDYTGHAEALAFLDHATELLAVVKPGYVREGKRLATIAIGCTGGKHRSTAMAVELARRLRTVGIATQVLHRDLGKE